MVESVEEGTCCEFGVKKGDLYVLNATAGEG